MNRLKEAQDVATRASCCRPAGNENTADEKCRGTDRNPRPALPRLSVTVGSFAAGVVLDFRTGLAFMLDKPPARLDGVCRDCDWRSATFLIVLRPLVAVASLLFCALLSLPACSLSGGREGLVGRFYDRLFVAVMCRWAFSSFTLPFF